VKKPKLLYKVDDKGQLVIPKTIPGYNADEVEVFQKWYVQKVATIKKDIGTTLSDRFKEEINHEIKGYFETRWGAMRALIKRRAKKKKILKRKHRRDLQLEKKIDKWNKLEDAKENKIFRDKERAKREERHEQFSFKDFLAKEREKKRHPYLIESETTFHKRLQEDMQNYLWKPPKSVRRQHRARNPIGYTKRLDREILDPFLIEIRRRARFAELVEQREEAIASAKYQQKLAEDRKKRLEERQTEFLKKQEHWNTALGGWHKENNLLRVMKREYMKERNEVLRNSRIEYLSALEEDHNFWEATPNECRFKRFRFIPNVKFPYNKTQYI